MKRKPSQFKLSPAQRQVLRLRSDGYDLSGWPGHVSLFRPFREVVRPRAATLAVLVREGFLYTRRLTILRGMVRYYLTAAGRKAVMEVV